MNGDQMKVIRHGLSEALSRELTMADMAKLCGLKDYARRPDGRPGNGLKTYYEWENGRSGDGVGPGPSGPVAVLLSTYSYAIDGHFHIDGMYDEETSFRKIMREIILYRLDN